MSGKPLPSTEGMYEIKITARNKKKMSAYITVVVQVMRGFKQMLDLRGADPDARVTVIERCRGEECNDYPMRDPVDNFPNKVIISPIPHTKR